MKNRLLVLLLLTALCGTLTTSGLAKHKKNQSSTASDSASSSGFDYYLLTLSWAPQFCATNSSGRTSTECDPNKHIGLVVHGLWPQYDNGKWPQDCTSTPPVSTATVNHMLPIMPGKQLIQHEWAKHGTCSGMTVNDYFAAIEKLYTNLSVPADFKQPSESSNTTASDIEAKFASANNAPKGAFRVSCPQNDFSAVEICLTKDLSYQACPTTVKECRAAQVQVRPVP